MWNARWEATTDTATPARVTRLETDIEVLREGLIDLRSEAYYFGGVLGEPRQGAERPSNAAQLRHGDPSNLIQFMLA